MKILSIIIPTYNMESYLTHCLDSLLVSDYMEQLEVLVINDGSKDCSSEIGHKYQECYPQTFRVIDKENGNYGSCINRGLKEATGKYIKVLDADDSFSTSALEIFLNFLQGIDVDLVLTDYNIVNAKGAITKEIRYHFPLNTSLPVEDYCASSDFLSVQMHGITYRRQMICDIGYHQNEGISYTDQEWIFEPMTQVQTFAFCNVVLYQYLVGREGQTMNAVQLAKHIDHNKKGSLTMLEAYNRHYSNCDVNMKLYLQNKLLTRIGYVYRAGLFKGYLSLIEMQQYDMNIKTINREIYNRTEMLDLFRYRYIYTWRKNMQEGLPILLVWLYRFLYCFKS